MPAAAGVGPGVEGFPLPSGVFEPGRFLLAVGSPRVCVPIRARPCPGSCASSAQGSSHEAHPSRQPGRDGDRRPGRRLHHRHRPSRPARQRAGHVARLTGRRRPRQRRAARSRRRCRPGRPRCRHRRGRQQPRPVRPHLPRSAGRRRRRRRPPGQGRQGPFVQRWRRQAQPVRQADRVRCNRVRCRQDEEQQAAARRLRDGRRSVQARVQGRQRRPQGER